MKSNIFIFTLYVLCEYGVMGLSFPGPRVYVVTPSARPLKNDEGKPAPFYYSNWIKRMDTGSDVTTTTTTEKPSSKLKTPDLIFAEFESNGAMQKSIRKLLEKERTAPKKTTMNPIYKSDEDENKVTRVVNYGLPLKLNNNNESSTENGKYVFMPHDNYYNNVPAPVYVTDPPTPAPILIKTTTPTSDTINIANIWHVIDNEKSNEYSNKWEEISFEPKNEENDKSIDMKHDQTIEKEQNHQSDGDLSFKQEVDEGDVKIDENFALPGFATNPGNGAENESRAIRTEQNIRFPYINLKPFQVKPSKKPSHYNLLNGKKNNLFTNLDNFYELKHPVRGEAQDNVPLAVPIDRYNPAQPYLPQQKYGNNLSKQSNPISIPSKATANLVPPPDLPPKSAGNDFPAPTSYESFPPYAPTSPDFNSIAAPSPPVSISVQPSQNIDTISVSDMSGPSAGDIVPSMEGGYRYKPPPNSDQNESPPMMNTGYQYKPPVIPTPQFYPTPIPESKPFPGYSYNKPSMMSDSMPMTQKPDFQGYDYKKPVYSKPPDDTMPQNYGPLLTYGHNDFPVDTYEHDDSPPHIYDHDDSSYSHDSKDPDLSYGSKPYGDIKGGDDMKDDDMGMKPPSPPSLHDNDKPSVYGPSMVDHGFPSDFPTDLKYPMHFDEDHDHYHYHETTTTTTEMPRVNRFSYYYLGKKLYYLPLYFSVYFIIYVGALIIKAVLRHKIVYPNSWRPNTTTASFFSKRSVDEYLSHENLHELTKKVTHAIATAAEKYMNNEKKIS